MIRDNQPALLAATGLVSLAIGFGAATLLMPQRPANQQIVDPNAWEEAAPEGVMPVSYAAPPKAPKCDPFDVSEVAMEAVLDEMQRRGWRAPSQGYAVSLIDAAGTMEIGAVDPNAPMPPRGGWPRAASDEETVEQLPVDQESPDAVVVVEPEEPAAPPAEQRPPA